MCFIHVAARMQANSGRQIPVDMTPGPVPVYRALKIHLGSRTRRVSASGSEAHLHVDVWTCSRASTD